MFITQPKIFISSTILDMPSEGAAALRAVDKEGSFPVMSEFTIFNLSEDRYVLYTRGSVHQYQTYPGMYIPAPLEIRIVRRVSSAKTICAEILGLTKMNWNSTQFDNKYPITIGCARKVGEIMKYLDENEIPKEAYAFYM